MSYRRIYLEGCTAVCLKNQFTLQAEAQKARSLRLSFNYQSDRYSKLAGPDIGKQMTTFHCVNAMQQ